MNSSADDSFFMDIINDVKAKNKIGSKYQDLLLDRLIEENTFLKVEILFLREIIKRQK